MDGKKILLMILGLAVLAACAQKGDKVYRTWVGPERSDMAVVTLHLGEDVRDITIRERELPRAEYGTIRLVPGMYTLHEKGDVSVGFNIRPILIDKARAHADGELILGHTYTLHAGKSQNTGERALWIEDARTGEIFVDSR